MPKLQIRDWSVSVNRPRWTPKRVFIRFGMWTTNSPVSYNHASGTKEMGLSVYPATILNDIVSLDESEIPAEEPDLPNRYAFPVTGRVVGYGSDGEPVLRGVKVLPYALNINTKRT